VAIDHGKEILAGETIGQAHRRAQNSILLSVLDRNEKDAGPNHYSLYIRTLFGDPAFVLNVPSKPRSAPAHVTRNGDVVTVHGPERWCPVKMRVPEDWKKWKDKDLYVCRGAGTYAVRYWCGEQYDKEELHVNAGLRTSRKVKAITQVGTPPKPLGWYGKYWVDENPGTDERTYRWRVRLLDFDQTTGKTVNKIDRIEYRIEWE